MGPPLSATPTPLPRSGLTLSVVVTVRRFTSRHDGESLVISRVLYNTDALSVTTT